MQTQVFSILENKNNDWKSDPLITSLSAAESNELMLLKLISEVEEMQKELNDLDDTGETYLDRIEEAQIRIRKLSDNGRYILDAIHRALPALNEFAPYLIYAPENFFLRRFEEDSQVKPLGFRGEGLFGHLVELSKEAPETFAAIADNLSLIDWYGGFAIPNDLQFTERRIAITDRFIADTIKDFDQRSANEGFLYLLFYFTLFLSKWTPKFFAIDNVDNALNPRLCAKLIEILAKLAKEQDKQAILTTHNPAILDGLDLHDDEQRLFVIYRNADGATQARRVKPLQQIPGAEPVRLSEAFVRGYLGGLPKNF